MDGEKKKNTHKVSSWLRDPWVCEMCLKDPAVQMRSKTKYRKP